MIWGALVLAAICWAITFGWTGGNFWIKIGLSVLAVLLYSLFWKTPKISFRFRSLVVGFFSAAVLYLVFFIGNELAPYVLHAANVQVGGIYSLGLKSNKILVFLLLFFVTGPGEEIFWRGFLQDDLMKRWGKGMGFLTTTVAYAAVHVFSGNPMLIFAALVAGAFWGLLYLWKKDLLIQMVSHSLWSAVIFVVAPIR